MRTGLLGPTGYPIAEFLSKLQAVKPRGENKWQAVCPVCGAAAHHFSVIDYGDGFAHCHCVKCDSSTGAVIDVIGKSDYVPKAVSASGPKDHGALIEHITYRYCDPKGFLQYMKVRKKWQDGHKEFYFLHYDQEGKKVSGKPDGAVSLYRHEYLKHALAIGWEKPLYIVEGEKCCDAMIKHGYLATSGNTGSKSKMTLDDIAVLQKFKCRIIPDNDEAGQAYIKVFQGLGIRDLVVIPMTDIWPECPPKGDMADYFKWKEVQDGTTGRNREEALQTKA